MKRVRFRRMLRWALAAPVTLLVLLALTFLLLIRWLVAGVDAVDHADRVISAAQETQALLIDMETGIRGYLLTQDENFLAPYRKAEPVVKGAFGELRRLVADNPPQLVVAKQIEAQYDQWHQLAAQMIVRNPNPALIVDAQIAGKEQMDAIRRTFARFVGTEELLRAKRSARVLRVTKIVIAVSMLTALLLGAIVGMFTQRALTSVAGEYQFALAESDEARVRAERLAIENERLYRDAQSANRAKDDFLATLSHELRTPLTAILGWSRLLQMGDQSEAATSTALSAIERSARSQAALIEDILDVSRIITGKLKLDVHEIDMRDVVLAAVQSVQPAADAKKIFIDVDAAESLPFSGDPNRVQQVIWNLVANSVKFSAPATRVAVSAKQHGGDIVVRVADQGRGIDSAFLPFVFDRFRQADSSSTREFSGLGIGLSVVKLLVELHGGTVTAESGGEGKGATFTVTFPVQRTAPVTTAVERAPVEPPQHPLDGQDVLVVDDDDDTRAVISAMLRTFGGRVEATSTVAEALRLMARRKFAVVLTDIAMPGEDGSSLLRRARELSGPNADTPIIAITALTPPRSPDGEPQFDATVTKPIDPAVLAATVASMIR